MTCEPRKTKPRGILIPEYFLGTLFKSICCCKVMRSSGSPNFCEIGCGCFSIPKLNTWNILLDRTYILKKNSKVLKGKLQNAVSYYEHIVLISVYLVLSFWSIQRIPAVIIIFCLKYFDFLDILHKTQKDYSRWRSVLTSSEASSLGHHRESFFLHSQCTAPPLHLLIHHLLQWRE